MSFGFGVGDFVTLGQLAWRVYKGCKEAPEGFQSLSKEVASFHAVIKEVEECVAGQTLSAWRLHHQTTIISSCGDTLEALQELVGKYASLDTKTKRKMDCVRFASGNIAQFRARLTSNTALLTAYMNTTPLVVSRKLEQILREYQSGRDEGSVISVQTIDTLAPTDKESWRSIRKELEEIGISIAAFNENRALIMDWFRRAVENGAFQERFAEESSSSAADDDTVKDLSDNEQVGVETSDDEAVDAEVADGILEFEPLGHPSFPGVFESPRQRLVPNRDSRSSLDVLYEATRDNGLAELRQLLASGVDLIAECKEDWVTLLNFASLHMAVATLMLRNYADLNSKNSGGDPLLSDHGHATIGRLLLEHGAEVNIQNRFRWTPLLLAAESGQLEVAKLLLEHGAKVDINDGWKCTPLHRAVTNGQVEFAELLLKHGAEVNIQNYDGRTPLHAVWADRVEVAKLLLEHGAKVDIKDEQRWTPLHSVVISGQVEVAKLLLEHDAKIDIKDKQGTTPLHLAAFDGQNEVAELLLEHGADVKTQN